MNDILLMIGCTYPEKNNAVIKVLGISNGTLRKSHDDISESRCLAA
jgi:hypothetical protein